MMTTGQSLERKPTNAADLGFDLREYRAADFDRLWEIDQLCFPRGIAYTQMELSGFLTARNAITLVSELRQNQEGSVAIPPTRDGHAQLVVGYVVAHSIRRKYGRILTLDIHPDARRLGLASALMNACETRLRSIGCSEVYLETAVDNAPAVSLYRNLGYRILRTLPAYYSSHSLDAFQMGKQL
jgi:[ribosomal protein S18]-alanine N-acetyltransferase